jgi:hypothetical protein
MFCARWTLIAAMQYPTKGIKLGVAQSPRLYAIPGLLNRITERTRVRRNGSYILNLSQGSQITQICFWCKL